ncbi:MAG: sugar transferase [Clostridia bacterium]|nr:sugar transferase [Clostridia bacterium]
MLLKKWEQLPDDIRNDEVKRYYDILKKKTASLIIKRVFDVAAALVLLVILSPVFLVTAIAIKLESEGPVMYRQVRKTTYGRDFRIHKFRSMYLDSDKGYLLTTKNDERVTKVGAFIRKTKIDELGQLIDVVKGDMTFVGVRPQVKKYTDHYTDEMKATLLLPAGITSLASIYYRNENDLLEGSEDPTGLYLAEILPDKMIYNLMGIKKLSPLYDLKILIMTLLAVMGKDYKPAKQVYSDVFRKKDGGKSAEAKGV